MAGPGVVFDKSAFTEKPIPLATQASETARALAELRIKDAQWRVKSRPRIGWVFIWLLICQNAVLVGGIATAAVSGELKDLTPIVIGVTAATLGETAAVVQIVVTWLFSDIDYKA